MTNRLLSWKMAFFVLLSMLIVVMIGLIVLISLHLPEVEERHFEHEIKSTVPEATFIIQTDRQRLNQFILQKIEEDKSQFRYMVELKEDYVQFRTVLVFFGKNVPVTINFTPIVADNGDLLLHLDTFSVGYFVLPAERVLQLTSEFIELPEWIDIYASDRLVQVKVTVLTLDERVSFRFITFDLVNDKIELDMTIN